MEINLFKKRILIQKVDREYVILITPHQNREGLTSLISDKNSLANFVNLKETQMLTQECELKFKPKG